MKIRRAKESDAADIAKVQVEVWRTTYQGIVPDDYLASLNRQKKEQRWLKVLASGGDDFTFVAEAEEKQVVGFASAGKNQDSDEKFAGELHTIYLLESFQKRGIGRLLVKAVAKQFAEQNIFSMLLWVLAENKFRAFYESLGGELISEKEIIIGDMPLTEVSYGWKDLRILVDR